MDARFAVRLKPRGRCGAVPRDWHENCAVLRGAEVMSAAFWMLKGLLWAIVCRNSPDLVSLHPDLSWYQNWRVAEKVGMSER